jgi:DNA-binding transcriptional regulator GbsR (MarR family)
MESRMNENFQKAQDICIEHAARISDLFGLSDGMARILALLYLSPEPVSIPVICEKLSLTKGTVSLYLRLLEERKIIARAWSRRKGKQKFYEMSPRLWVDFLEDMRKRARRRLEMTEEAIDKSLEAIRQGEKEYEGEDRVASRLLMERLERVREMNNISRIMLNNFLGGKTGPQDEGPRLSKIELSDE